MSLLLLALVACDAPTPSSVPLVDAGRWRPVAPEHDPWAAERPPEVACDPAGLRVEEGVLEVDTGLCGWATLSQPLAEGLLPGDVVEVLAWHNALTGTRPPDSGEPELGVMRLRVGSVALWELERELPASSDVYTVALGIEHVLPAGLPVVLHVHNHGSNSWRFGGMGRR